MDLEAEIEVGDYVRSSPITGGVSQNAKPGRAPGWTPLVANVKSAVVTAGRIAKRDRFAADNVCGQLERRALAVHRFQQLLQLGLQIRRGDRLHVFENVSLSYERDASERSSTRGNRRLRTGQRGLPDQPQRLASSRGGRMRRPGSRDRREERRAHRRRPR